MATRLDGQGTSSRWQRWPWEKWVAGKQWRPHLCPHGITPLMDGHRWGLKGGQGDVVSREQLHSDSVGTATVSSSGEPRRGWGSGLCTPRQRVALVGARKQAYTLQLLGFISCAAQEAHLQRSLGPGEQPAWAGPQVLCLSRGQPFGDLREEFALKGRAQRCRPGLSERCHLDVSGGQAVGSTGG